ncbi:MAG: hypothetical protein FJX19_00370 [Alphaproteobacteria bacterium]|nr:hypothetical protein [Alphaproteobacteria bacterium]
MAGVEASQIVIVVAFLALLVVLQVWVRRNREGLGARLRPGREVDIIETVAIAPQERLTLVRIGTQRVLVLSARGAGAQMLALGPDIAPPPEGGAP